MKIPATLRWFVPAAVSLAVLGCATTPTPEEAAAAAVAAEEAARQERFDSQMVPFRAWQRKFESASDRRDRPAMAEARAAMGFADRNARAMGIELGVEVDLAQANAELDALTKGLAERDDAMRAIVMAEASAEDGDWSTVERLCTAAAAAMERAGDFIEPAEREANALRIAVMMEAMAEYERLDDAFDAIEESLLAAQSRIARGQFEEAGALLKSAADAAMELADADDDDLEEVQELALLVAEDMKAAMARAAKAAEDAGRADRAEAVARRLEDEKEALTRRLLETESALENERGALAIAREKITDHEAAAEAGRAAAAATARAIAALAAASEHLASDDASSWAGDAEALGAAAGADGVDAAVKPFADALAVRIQSAAARKAAVAAHADAMTPLIEAGDFDAARASVEAYRAAAQAEGMTALDKAWVSGLASAQAVRLAQAEAARDERNRLLAIAGGVAALLAIVVVVQFVRGRRKAA
jgi:SWI/SNF-related matrix-associated actin-dependent regulator 1 of chromatin subfamily A